MKLVKYLVLGLYVLFQQYNIVVAQQQVSISEAKKAAAQALNIKQGKKVPYDETRVERVNTLKNEKEATLMYEVVFDDGQGILLSGSRACSPILGIYDVPAKDISIFGDDAPDGLKCMLEEYEEQIELCFQNDTIQLYYQNEWQVLLQKEGITEAIATGNIIVQPLLTSCWGQSNPNGGTQSNQEQCSAYNYFVSDKNCNRDNDCSTHQLAGCVAVAMAQIIYYWKQPVRMATYDMRYDWCNMVDGLNTDSSNYINERNAVARLIKDCGDAADMDFGCSSSGSNIRKAKKALVNNFGFNKNAEILRKNWHTSSDWKNVIKNDLSEGRPIFYRGQSSDFSPDHLHAFVCDGYTDDDLFHFNWGKRCSYDGWFTLDNLNPYNNYTSRQRAILYLRPNSTQDDYCDFELPLNECFYWRYRLSFPSISPEDVPKDAPKYTTTLISAYPAIIHNNFTVPSSWYTIELEDGPIIYPAHQEVRLKPGFHAKAGSEFRAYIEPCPNCENRNSSMLAVSTSEELNETNNSSDDTMPMGTKSLQAETNGKEITLYPNPNNGTFQIDANFPLTDIADFKIINLLGIPIYETQNLTSNTIQLGTSTSGYCFVIMILKDGSVLTQKMVIQR